MTVSACVRPRLPCCSARCSTGCPRPGGSPAGPPPPPPPRPAAAPCPPAAAARASCCWWSAASCLGAWPIGGEYYGHVTGWRALVGHLARPRTLRRLVLTMCSTHCTTKSQPRGLLVCTRECELLWVNIKLRGCHGCQLCQNLKFGDLASLNQKIAIEFRKLITFGEN